jgi:diguanylate cyclase (GGDEF)-like protein/PAS domain S-box-containing protein
MNLTRRPLFRMEDYRPEAKAYWWTIVALGAAALVLAILEVAAMDRSAILHIAAGATIAAIMGMFPVRVPGGKSSVAGAEIFIFLLLLMYGPSAAVLAAVAEAAVSSWRSSGRATNRVGTPAMAALAMGGCGTAFTVALAFLQSGSERAPGILFGLLLVLAVGYFAAVTLLAASLVTLKRGEPVHALRTLWNHGWLGLMHAASASVAGLLYVSFDRFGVPVLMATVPILAMFLSTVHFYLREAELNDRVRKERLAAADREAAETAKHLAELRESEDRFHSAFTHAAIGMTLVSTDGRIMQANSALARLVGSAEAELAGKDLASIMHPDDGPMLREKIAHLVEGADKTFVIELRCRHRADTEIWVSLDASFFSGTGSMARCLIVQMQDVTARRDAESRLHHIAYHDALTNLPNRGYFVEQLSRAIATVRRHPERRFAVLYLDFDRFKLINDSLGHSAGDALLIGIARRLQAALRPSDVVARLGGDEFAILVEDLNADREVVQLAERLQGVLAEPLLAGGLEISTSVSIGITTSAFGYDSPEQVMRDADLAMYRAKVQGKAQYAIFDSALHEDVTLSLWLEGELRRAIVHDQLELAYQPIFELSSRRLTGLEVLARWNHPERGEIPPERFIRVAEETGLIVSLGNWVLATACRQFGTWQRNNPGCEGLSLHVNVSGIQLSQPDFSVRVQHAVAAAGIEPSRLTLELTESVLIQKVSSALAHLDEIRRMGVEVSIDDFGTGYSSLSLLQDLPIGEIKVDRSFVRRLGERGEGEEVVRAILALGRTLGKRVVAEGIETEAQLQQLLRLECDRGQGFLLAHPTSAGDIQSMIQDSLAIAPPGTKRTSRTHSTRRYHPTEHSIPDEAALGTRVD